MLVFLWCKDDSSALEHMRSGGGQMTCQKCKGLMVKEWRPEFSQEAAVLRCINCGLVLDPLIAQNRVTPLRAKQRVLNAA
jgi:hypothetical protein